MHKYNNNIADRCTDRQRYTVPTAACRTWDRPLIVLHEHKVPKTWAMLLREKMCLKHVPYNDSDHSSCGNDYWWRLYQVNKYLQIWFLLQDNKSPVSNIFSSSKQQAQVMSHSSLEYPIQLLPRFLHQFPGFPVAQMVEHGTSNAKIMGSIPRESKSWSNVKL